MNTSSNGNFAEVYANVLRGFGLSRSDLDDPHGGEGPLTAETIAWDVQLDDPDEAYVQLQQAFARSTRGIEAPRHYWSQAPAFQIDDVLERYGYEVSFEGPDGGEFRSPDGGFTVRLAGEDCDNRTTFQYPETPHGDDDYPALVHTVETRLLPRGDLTFVRLDGNEDAWRFVLVEEDRLAELQSTFGERIEVFGRPLLAAEQPEDAADRIARSERDEQEPDDSREGFTGEFESAVPTGNIDEVFESIEREVATNPVGTVATDPADVDEDVSEILTSVEGTTGVVSPAIRDVSSDRIDEVVDRFEADPTAIEDASARPLAMATPEPAPDDDAGTPTGEEIDGPTDEEPEGVDDTPADEDAERSLRSEHVPSPSPGRSEPTGLSAQVAAALYEDGGAGDQSETPGPADRNDDPPTGFEERDPNASMKTDVGRATSRVDSGSNEGSSIPGDRLAAADSPTGDEEYVPNPFEAAREVSDEEVVDAGDVMRPIVEDDETEDEDDQGRFGRLTDTVRNIF